MVFLMIMEVMNNLSIPMRNHSSTRRSRAMLCMKMYLSLSHKLGIPLVSYSAMCTEVQNTVQCCCQMAKMFFFLLLQVQICVSLSQWFSHKTAALQKKKGCLDSIWLPQFHTSSASLSTVETHCLIYIPNSD